MEEMLNILPMGTVVMVSLVILLVVASAATGWWLHASNSPTADPDAVAEIWFRQSFIRGFGVVHWKGPLFIVPMTIPGALLALFAIVNSQDGPVVAACAALLAIGILLIGNHVCGLHTEKE
jgi:hypothetical protein